MRKISMKTASYFTYTGPGRIGISRGVPRGIPAGYRMFRALAPGPWFRSVDATEYCWRYRREILDRLDPQETWDRLHELAGGQEPVLLCWERPPFTRETWCHRRLVSEFFERELSVEVPEHEAPSQRVEDYLGLRPFGSFEAFQIDDDGQMSDVGLH
jgi:hypothetical protein